jgi:hypothetical protein
MKKVGLITRGCVLAVGAITIVGMKLHAADHKDGPAATAEPSADGVRYRAEDHLLGRGQRDGVP